MFITGVCCIIANKCQNNVAIQVKSSGSSPTLQSKSVTPSSSTQIVLPDSGYDGLNQITIEKIPENYIKIN